MRLLPLLLLPLHLASAGTFFWATDMHVDIWGELGNPSDEICAWTPSAQLQSAVAAMSSIDAAPDFILCSGDIVHFPNRNSSDLSKDVVLQTHTAFTDYIRASFPSTPLYSALGNHDLHPSNNWPTNVEDSSWLYSHLSEIWSPFLPASSLDQLSKTGYYAVDASPTLRIITLNTNYWTVYNTGLPWDTGVAETQFAWLESELQRAAADDKRVYINGHHPAVGVHVEGGVEVGGLWPLYQQRFAMLHQQFAASIAASFFGHDHVDETRLVRSCTFESGNPDPDSSSVNSCSGDASGVVYVGQALTNCHTPAFRAWEYDVASAALTDYTQYAMKTDEATGELSWPEQYTWSAAYDAMADLSPASWQAEIERMQSNWTAFEAFTERRGVGCDKGDEKCRTFTLCNYLFGSGHAELLDCLYSGL
ncbi:hypothetical protein TeGR_g1806 [Tetraparma gracilis]|uniref:Calcineurin-like phosphoesterase domain-containing protein n=1 Tax=Tetraparma gracilis TaxID=2962635 RepID=A0ABQ6ME03_9STRA|nr:hypothetical protein TeGR_g1806 [Tetraparma gracilis]